MSQIISAILLVIILASGAFSAKAADIAEVFIRVGLPAAAPFGWQSFCERYSSECEPGPDAPAEIEGTSANLALIEHVNRLVNRRITPLSDANHWGVEDRWDLPSDGYGDCEDFALYKRKLLHDLGLQRQALLITVVLDKNGGGHAVLMVKTTKGDFILDSAHDHLTLWSKSDYRFVKRQTTEHPDRWVSIAPPAERYHMVAK